MKSIKKLFGKKKDKNKNDSEASSLASNFSKEEQSNNNDDLDKSSEKASSFLSDLSEREQNNDNIKPDRSYETPPPIVNWSPEVDNWKDIHPDFTKHDCDYKLTYEQEWESRGIFHHEAKKWIQIGFKPNDYEKIYKWKWYNFTPPWVKQWLEAGFKLDGYYEAVSWNNYGFTPQEVKSWIDVGLNKYDYEFASFLKKNNHNPANAFQEKNYIQTWLDWKYPQKEKKTLKNYAFIKKTSPEP